MCKKQSNKYCIGINLHFNQSIIGLLCFNYNLNLDKALQIYICELILKIQLYAYTQCDVVTRALPIYF